MTERVFLHVCSGDRVIGKVMGFHDIQGLARTFDVKSRVLSNWLLQPFSLQGRVKIHS